MPTSKGWGSSYGQAKAEEETTAPERTRETTREVLEERKVAALAPAPPVVANPDDSAYAGGALD